MPVIHKIDNKFGAQTFFALRHTGEICGSNGLPLTPNSIVILGRAQILKSIKHKYLASQIDFIRGKHERIVVVSEHHLQTLSDVELSFDDIIQLSYQILTALAHLNKYGIVHRMLSPDNIVLDEERNVKLFNYGLYYITGSGRDVSFPIGIPKYTAPEVFLLSATFPDYSSSPKVDIWSVGIILLELIFKKQLWPNLKVGQYLRKVLSLIHCDDVLGRLARELDSFNFYEEMQSDLKDFIQCCLNIDPQKRPTADQLLRHSLFNDISFLLLDHRAKKYSGLYHPLNNWKLSELYHLWQLAGGDVQGELKKNGLIRNKSPILSIPKLILLEGMTFGNVKDESLMLDLRVVQLPLDALVSRLKRLPVDSYYPLLETQSSIIKCREVMEDARRLPLIIRELDTEYQFHRIVLFKRLLQCYPYKKDVLYNEAFDDIPPYYRGKVWASLLNVKGDIDNLYAAIDKETEISSDRQIEVDIPRCHQYNDLLSSKTGHLKLKRILKAWVVSNPDYVYWQGLDSLCAPFLYLNFNREARAYACLSAFIQKYLNNLFLKDNSSVMNEYLIKFSHLIVFHDPILANHLRDIHFVPDLFAIPWFLTVFSHVFPLHKTFHLWDKLILGDDSYPLYVGFIILQQLRDTLLSSGFNECILLFSDLPEVDIEKCVSSLSELHMNTPRSITFRKCQASSDYDMDLTRADMIEIHSEYCPRISSFDVTALISCKDTRADLLIVDIRSSSEYCEGAIPGSINIPFGWINFSKDIQLGGIPAGPELSVLINNKGNMVIVIGDVMVEAAKFCEHLAKNEFPKVCFVHRGINELQNAGILAPVIT